jgi:hypothetical protein
MAKIIYGSGINQISGTLDGVVYSRNRFGGYARRYTVPVNPNSARQQSVRNTFQELTEHWNTTLTAAQRTAWNLYGANVPVLDRFGASINLTGFQHYLRSNTVIRQCGLTRVDDGPTTFALPETDGTFSASASEATQEISITFDDAAGWASEDNAAMPIYGGRPQLATRDFFAGPWRFADSIDGDQAGAPTSPATVTSAYTITEGQRLWIYGRIVRADGRLSDPFRSDLTVGA